MPQAEVYKQFDFSGAVNSRASRLLRKPNEVLAAKNAVFNFKIGAAARRFGYEQLGQTLQYNNDGQGLHVFEFGDNSKMLAAINDSTHSFTTLNFMDGDQYWKTLALPITVAPSTQIQWTNALDQCFVVGKAPGNTYMPMLNIDYSLNVSTTRNTYGAPAAKYITEFQGKLYAINTQVKGTTYSSRIYISSAPTGVVTFIQNPQQGLLQQLHVDSVRYLKSGMTLDIYSAGTNALQNTITIISVDKKNNNITFSPVQVNLNDRDEVWLTGQKGQLSYLWNTDYPTPESADWLRIPPGAEENPAITGWGKNNNRLLLFTKNSTWKWDGANLTQISNQVGCASHESIQTISNWTIFLHSTGVWGYNDMFGQLRLLSSNISNYILAATQNGLTSASAVVSGRMYKLSVGQIGVLDASTTSTSTSSTSTSSTSSSTSSTSTSSTSLSSTSSSSSTSSTSASTSSTSASTSSTSTSSTSSSVSTSSTSSSTSTSSTTTTTLTNTRQIVRLVYDFDMNAWWPEYHTREIRYQVNYTMNGYTKPYFQDDTGKVFRDETGNTDGKSPYFNGDLIPFELELGQNNFANELVKNYLGFYVESDNARGTLVYISVDGDQYVNIGEMLHDNDAVKVPPRFKTGRSVSVKFVNITGDDRPMINGITTWYSQLENTLGGSAGKIF